MIITHVKCSFVTINAVDGLLRPLQVWGKLNEFSLRTLGREQESLDSEPFFEKLHWKVYQKVQ